MSSGKITTLVENVVYQSGLVAEHGFSALVEWNGTSILFDFGQSARFLENAVCLGVDPGRVDVAVVSHGHYDHTGGLFEFLSMNPRADIWMREAALDPKASTTKKTIGVPNRGQLDNRRLRFPQTLTEIGPGAFLLPPAPLVHPEDFHGEGLLAFRNGVWAPDDFSDEQSLVLVGPESIAVVSACSHRGIANILHSARQTFGLPIELVVGGFHWRQLSPSQLDHHIALLEEFSVRRWGICHCTGVEALGRFQASSKAEVFYNHTGRVVSWG